MNVLCRKSFLAGLFVLCVAGEPAAQSFNSLKNKTETVYDAVLNRLLTENDVKEMENYLKSNPAAVNSASSSNSQRGIHSNKSIVGTVPLFYDAVERTLKGDCPVEMCRVIVDAGCEINPVFDGKTPVYLLLDYLATHPKEQCAIAEQLLNMLVSRQDFDVNYRYKSLLPPLAYLIRENYHFLGKFDKSYLSDQVLSLLIDRGAPVNTYDNDGNSLMTFAVDTENELFQSYLLSKGIDLSRKNKTGNDALYQAVKGGQTELVKQIIHRTGFNLNIYSLPVSTDSFRMHRDTYDYIAEVCASKIESYGDITLFRSTFSDKLDLVQSKLNAFDEQTYQTVSVETGGNYRHVVAAYEKYLDMFPDGLHVAEVNGRISILKAQAAKDEIDDANKYVKILQHDVFYAKGDGLNIWEWFVSSGTDIQNLNVFVLGQITNTGKLPKKIKVSVALYIDTDIQTYFLLMQLKSTINIKTLVEECFFELYPGESDALGVHFKVQETVWETGNAFLGSASSTYIRRGTPYHISIEFFDGNIPESTLLAQRNLIATLREHGNVAIKEGYSSQYHQVKANIKHKKREKAIEKCMQCEMDTAKFKIPTERKNLIGMTVESPGEIVMKDESKYYYYWDEEKGLKVKGVVWDDYYDTWEEMKNAFLDACRRKNCGEEAVRKEADRRKNGYGEQEE
ncbi:MAG: hypothetical protein LBB90_03220 [Tannerella sp.]|jgi:hypothetical protein|nr:hypothetical protein [Tannerella sp.]